VARRGLEDDRARDRTLAVAGWRTARITDTTLEHEPGMVAQELEALLDRRRG